MCAWRLNSCLSAHTTLSKKKKNPNIYRSACIEGKIFVSLLGNFTKLRKEIIIFVVSVRPPMSMSVHIEIYVQKFKAISCV